MPVNNFPVYYKIPYYDGTHDNQFGQQGRQANAARKDIDHIVGYEEINGEQGSKHQQLLKKVLPGFKRPFPVHSETDGKTCRHGKEIG